MNVYRFDALLLFKGSFVPTTDRNAGIGPTEQTSSGV